MAGSNGGSLEKRVSVLERLAKKNEERWEDLTRFLKANQTRQREQDRRFESRMRAHDERFESLMRVVVKQNEKIERQNSNLERQNARLDKLEQSVDATLKILYRLLERTGLDEPPVS